MPVASTTQRGSTQALGGEQLSERLMKAGNCYGIARMQLYSHVPGPPLADLIERFWYVECVPSHRFERLLPSGNMALVCSLDGADLLEYGPLGNGPPSRFAGPAIKGAYSRAFVVDTRIQRSLIGVNFRAGGAYPFLGNGADRFVNRHVALAEVWEPRVTRNLHERLLELRTPRARFAHLEAVLLARYSDLHGRTRRHSAVGAALASLANRHGACSIAALVRESGLSWRRFIELFRREIGVPPKSFARLCRFQHALRRLVAEPRQRTAQLAFDSGYCDQAHLLRDFAAFANTTPARYLAMRGELLNYLPLPGR